GDKHVARPEVENPLMCRDMFLIPCNQPDQNPGDNHDTAHNPSDEEGNLYRVTPKTPKTPKMQMVNNTHDLVFITRIRMRMFFKDQAVIVDAVYRFPFTRKIELRIRLRMHDKMHTFIPIILDKNPAKLRTIPLLRQFR